MSHSIDIASLILAYADKHWQPYQIHGEELIPEFCPFCDGGRNHDKHTFAINLSTGAYNCLRGSCAVKGAFSDLTNKFKTNVSYNSFKMPLFSSKTYDLPNVELLPLTEECRNYLNLRGFSDEAIEETKIASDKHGNIVIPHFEKGNLVYVKFRKPHKHIKGEPKEWQVSNTKPILFNMENCVFSKPLVITEGAMDTLAIVTAGYHNCVSVPCGTNNLEWIDHNWLWLNKFSKIILFGDSDSAGLQMTDVLAKRLGESRCCIVSDYPTHSEDTTILCKDANEILYFYGAEAILELIDNAELIPARGILDLADIEPLDLDSIERIKCNIPALDSALGGLTMGSITVFTGKSGQGKSTLTGLLLLEAIQQGYKVCAYSGELNKELFQSWINFQCAGSEYIGLKHDSLCNKQVPYLDKATQLAIRDFYRGKFFLFDNNEIFESNQEEAILSVFTLAVKRYGCKLFLVDNMMTAIADADERLAAQSRFVNSLKTFAHHYGVHVLLVAHPRKTRIDQPLGKDDVGGSSDIVNLADNAIVVERPNLRIIKNRSGGNTPYIECIYCKDSRRIYQADIGDRYSFDFNKTGLIKPSVRADSLPEYGLQTGQDLPF